MQRDDTPAPSKGRSLILDRRDWVYVLGLLVPLIAYNLALKAARISSLPDEHGLVGSLVLIRSDLLFGLGYALFWIGLFAVARRGLSRLTVLVLFHAAAILVALVTTAYHRFFVVTGTTLDAATILFFIFSPGEVGPVAASELTLPLVVTLIVSLAYAIFGPLILVRMVFRRRGSTAGGAAGRSWPAFAGMALLAYALFSLSLLPGGGPAGASETFARDAFVNVAVSEVEGSGDGTSLPRVDAEKVREGLPTETRLERTARTEKRNVVVIHLESTRARSVTPYNEEIETTPFLDELSKKSLFAERAYAVVPHTTNALVAALCGIEPPDRSGTSAVGDGIPARCLPELLDQQGYNSVYFTSSVQTFERRPEVVENMGYEEFYPVETMDTEGFQKANYFGYEDDVMLEPSRKWLEKNGDEPFIATYETITPHHQYLAPDKRYGRKDFAEDDTLNRYQNTVRYVDFFVKNLIEQYKELGLYEDTVFVIYGDHGEAFGEHGRYQHDNVIWEEGLRVPLMIVDPSRPAERIERPVSQLDILPTVADLLGYGIAGGEYPGYSVLDLPEERTLMFACWYENKCLASLEGDEKYVYHFGNQPEEFYDLSEDPLEKDNLADEVPPEELAQRRDELLEWRARADAAYGE
ncbi:Phosphoglycerol transferase I [Rubrobacter xylanophilus DSM 9941]|uniref:LTA synthase family protein n=1 Tax=Rubrobacter xylanophilus TaxID=49319 RepID=UPI001C63C23A|nr:LTA synthase family protein [Rubrobacter xylanophilus]QYJ14212.1 Phosphoglycerol transferase I [Rubrobacter xylanophilus DSM 9941]